MKVDVDPALVERYLLELAQHGAYGETGVWRTAYSPEWVAAQDQVSAWLEDAGLEVRSDAVGNVWGRLAGAEGGRVVATGSHVDSQNPGGRYDGALGVIAGILAVSIVASLLFPKEAKAHDPVEHDPLHPGNGATGSMSGDHMPSADRAGSVVVEPEAQRIPPAA